MFTQLCISLPPTLGRWSQPQIRVATTHITHCDDWSIISGTELPVTAVNGTRSEVITIRKVVPFEGDTRRSRCGLTNTASDPTRTAATDRGYLIPGTPELTKRYIPAWALKLFGRTPVEERPLPDSPNQKPATDADQLDPIEVLAGTGVPAATPRTASANTVTRRAAR